MVTTNKKILVIMGATGNQGFSVAETFLRLEHWHVRCITRNPSSPVAQKLDSLGAEVVRGDLDDRDSIFNAFVSAHAIFANTDFWTIYFDPSTREKAAVANQTPAKYTFDVEVSQGQVIADAAAAVTSLERFVFSALPPADKATSEQIADCYHWDSKIAVLQYVHKAHPELAAKMSAIYLGAYATNAFIIPRWDKKSSSYKIMLPMGPSAQLPIVDAKTSTGLLTRALIETEEKGVHLLAYDTHSKLTRPQVAEIWSRVTGKHITYEQTSVEYMHTEFGIPYEILAGAVLIDKFGYMHGVEEYIESPQLKDQIRTPTYEEWLRANWRDLLPAAAGEQPGL